MRTIQAAYTHTLLPKNTSMIKYVWLRPAGGSLKDVRHSHPPACKITAHTAEKTGSDVQHDLSNCGTTSDHMKVSIGFLNWVGTSKLCKSFDPWISYWKPWWLGMTWPRQLRGTSALAVKRAGCHFNVHGSLMLYRACDYSILYIYTVLPIINHKY